jgi:hypothetical protein
MMGVMMNKITSMAISRITGGGKNTQTGQDLNLKPQHLLDHN